MRYRQSGSRCNRCACHAAQGLLESSQLHLRIAHERVCTADQRGTSKQREDSIERSSTDARQIAVPLKRLSRPRGTRAGHSKSVSKPRSGRPSVGVLRKRLCRANGSFKRLALVQVALRRPSKRWVNNATRGFTNPGLVLFLREFGLGGYNHINLRPCVGYTDGDDDVTVRHDTG